jgi:hypothetical protein
MGSCQRRPTQGAWREYDHLSGLYTFYLALVVKAFGGYSVIVGGVLTLVLSNVRDEPVLVVALLVPILLSVLLAVAARLATHKVGELEDAIVKVAGRSRVERTPHIEILEWLVTWSWRLLAVAAVLLAGLLTWLVFTAN